MTDSTTTVFVRQGVLECEKRSPALSFAPASDHFTLTPPLSLSGLLPPDLEPFMAPYKIPTTNSSSKQRRRGPAARTIFGQVYSKKDMLSHASSMMEVEKGPVKTVTINVDEDIYKPSGLLSFDDDSNVIDETTPQQSISNLDNVTSNSISVPTDNSFTDMFLSVDVGKELSDHVDVKENDKQAATKDTVKNTADNSSSSFDFDSNFDFDSGELGGGLNAESTALESSHSKTSSGHTPTTSADNDLFNLDASSRTTTSTAVNINSSTSSKRSNEMKNNKAKPQKSALKKSSSDGKVSLAPPSTSTASSSAAIAKRKKQAAAANSGLKPPPLKLAPVKKPLKSTSSIESSQVSNSEENVKTSLPFQEHSDGNKAGSLDNISSLDSVTLNANDSTLGVDFVFYAFEELLCVLRHGTIEKFDITGNLKCSASSLRIVEGGEICSLMSGEVLDLVVHMSSQKKSQLAVVSPAPSSNNFSVSASGGEGTVGAKLTALPVSTLPLLSYRAASTFRPELIRAKSSATVCDGGKGILVAIQIMLNTNFHNTLENIQVMASFASIVDASGSDDVKNVESRPASGVYNRSSRVLTWECGSHLPSNMPILKMEARLVTPPSLLTNPDRIPSTIPVIVKAFLNTPLLSDCTVDVESVSLTRPESVEALPKRNVIVSPPPSKKYRSKFEYRFL